MHRRRIREVLTSVDDTLTEADANPVALLRQDARPVRAAWVTPAVGTTMATTSPQPGDRIPRGADGMVSKEDAGYGYAPDPTYSCGRCAHFDPRGACALVRGMIRPVDFCGLWAPRRNGADHSLVRKEAHRMLTREQRRDISTLCDQLQKMLDQIRQRYGTQSGVVESFQEAMRGDGPKPKIRAGASLAQSFKDAMR